MNLSRTGRSITFANSLEENSLKLDASDTRDREIGPAKVYRCLLLVNIWEQERGSFIYRVNYCFRVQLVESVARRVEKFVCSKHRRQPWRVGAKDVCDNRVAGVLFKCDEEASSNESPASLGLLAAFASTVHSWNIASCDKRLRSRLMRLCFERTCYTWKGGKVEKKKKERREKEVGIVRKKEEKKWKKKKNVSYAGCDQNGSSNVCRWSQICPSVLERAVCFRVQWTYRQCNARASNFCSRSLLFVSIPFLPRNPRSSWYWNSWKEILIKERIAIIGG